MNFPDLMIRSERSRFKSHLLTCLGGEWPEPCPLNPRVVERIQREDHTLEKVEYQVEPGECVTSYVLVPNKPICAPTPAIAVWHQHNGEHQFGKSEPAGLMGSPIHHTGVALVQEGYIVICPDAIAFEERRDSTKKNLDCERFIFQNYLMRGKSLIWKNILDMRRAVDYLSSREDVDKDRIGCYGHSLGSTFGWMVAPWEDRLKCIVGNCCLPTYEAMENEKIVHSFSNYVPGLFQFGDTPEIVSLIAPRPLHLNFGELDAGNPINAVKEALRRIANVYKSLDASENFSYLIEQGVGHTLTARMWEEAKAKFQKHL